MGLKDNFSQAVKELMNKEKAAQAKTSETSGEINFKSVDQYMKEETSSENPVTQSFMDKQTAEPEQPKVNAQPPAKKEPEIIQERAKNEDKAPASVNNPQTEPPSYFAKAENSANAPRSEKNEYIPQPAFRPNTFVDDDETTIISRNTIIDGNIRSFANMSIDGNIKGDVETTKDVAMNGKIVGNITCNNAIMTTSAMQGNVKLKGKIDMARDSLLIGDLSSQYADLNGKVKGNIDISGKAELKKDAVIFGDIKASTISILDGAIIQGYVSTTFLSKDDGKNIFPENIAIGE